eukprot:Rhum_TRINITY_DN14773_c19_g1::Rhum_TRINITY_DN14773_c19_g1_i1::g.117358::m.117358
MVASVVFVRMVAKSLAMNASAYSSDQPHSASPSSATAPNPRAPPLNTSLLISNTTSGCGGTASPGGTVGTGMVAMGRCMPRREGSWVTFRCPGRETVAQNASNSCASVTAVSAASTQSPMTVMNLWSFVPTFPYSAALVATPKWPVSSQSLISSAFETRDAMRSDACWCEEQRCAQFQPRMTELECSDSTVPSERSHDTMIWLRSVFTPRWTSDMADERMLSVNETRMCPTVVELTVSKVSAKSVSSIALAPVSLGLCTGVETLIVRPVMPWFGSFFCLSDVATSVCLCAQATGISRVRSALPCTPFSVTLPIGISMGDPRIVRASPPCPATSAALTSSVMHTEPGTHAFSTRAALFTVCPK